MTDETLRHPAAGERDAAEFFAEEVRRWREKEFQGHVVRLAMDLGWSHIYHVHFSERSEKGFPDLVLVRPRDGRLGFAEVKTMKGRLTEPQVAWLAALSTVQGDGTVRVCLWRPCCWLSGEIQDVLR